MKALVVLAALAGLVWLLTRPRRLNARHRAERSTAAREPETMVRCAHCGTHVPQADALRGRQGWYCSAAHRDQHEG
ncbi:MAG: hypothetical protein HZY78_03600 [Burkholderiaceae bacterium]|nr:MAG: hypothetical protein HZY78_03600 [Burkholderiaceae bacterium]